MSKDEGQREEHIARGVAALRRFRNQHSQRNLSSERKGRPATLLNGEGDHCTRQQSLEKDCTTQGTPGELRCPFATKMTQKAHHCIDASTHRTDALAPPPDFQEQLLEDPIAAEFHANDVKGPPSTSGSAPKCPIRFLENHSPEEVAQYFENHKHEIPRSHAVCVQRYQSNAESIRQLDAKYGSLVSMIQGLGLKHQPLLPTEKNESSAVSHHTTSQPPMENVEQWAEEVAKSASQSDMKSEPRTEERAQAPPFDRPLHDVRLGESPSRPWGIQVPDTQEPTPSAKEDDSGDFRPRTIPNTACDGDGGGEPWPTSRGGLDEEASQQQDNDMPNGCPMPRPHGGQGSGKEAPPQACNPTTPHVVFNGPVFLGYSAEDASALLQGYGRSR